MSKHNSIWITVLLISTLIVLLICCSNTVYAQQFHGGTGDSDDPFQIASASQLLQIGADLSLLDKCYVLNSDIDLDPNKAAGRAFQKAVIAPSIESNLTSETSALIMPLGDTTVAVFQGSFNGNGHVIRNMTISADQGQALGLFGYVGAQASICDLRLENARVAGQRHLGLLAGINFGSISYCRASGAVTGDNRIGGLIGTNRGSVTCCQSDTQVAGKDIVGGLVGHMLMNTSMINCQAQGQVSGDSHVGGLIGQMLRGRVIGCSASGTVYSETNAGGLIGSGPHQGSLSRCVSTAHVSGVLVGGLIGIAQCTNITHCYAGATLRQLESNTTLSTMTGKGGLAGQWKSSHGFVHSSCWDMQTSGTEKAVGINSSRTEIILIESAGATRQQIRMACGPASHVEDLKVVQHSGLGE